MSISQPNYEVSLFKEQTMKFVSFLGFLTRTFGVAVVTVWRDQSGQSYTLLGAWNNKTKCSP